MIRPPATVGLVRRRSTRRRCCDCGKFTYVYSTETSPGLYRRHRCTVCTLRANGITVCQCGLALKPGRCGGTWLHADGKGHGHRATPQKPVAQREAARREDCPQQPWCTCSWLGEQPCSFYLSLEDKP